MQFSRLYNKKAFNTQHDISVSLRFCIYNPVSTCSGGLNIAFYEDSLISPNGGGIDGSLGYAPYTNTIMGSSFKGLQNAKVGVSLDITGDFSKKADGRKTGDYKSHPNAISFRDSQKNDYKLLSYTDNLYNLYNLNLGQNFTQENNAIFYNFRISLLNQARKIRVEQCIKPDQFVILAEQDLEYLSPAALRVACSFVSPDDTTKCKIQEFNVYGFFDDFAATYDTEIQNNLFTCIQNNKMDTFDGDTSSKIFVGTNNLFAERYPNTFYSNYIKTTDIPTPYLLQQTVVYPFSATHKFVASDNNNLLVSRENSNNDLKIYRNMGRKIFEEYTIYSPGISGFGESVSIDKNFLYVSTVSSVQIYKRTGYNWNPFQTFLSLSARPYNTKFKTNRGILSYHDGSVEILEGDNLGSYNSVFFLSAVESLSSGFGQTVDITDSHAIVTAPNKKMVYFDEGAVFVFTKNSSWSLSYVLTGGEMPAATFGKSACLYNNTLAVGSPGSTVSLNSYAGFIKVYKLEYNGSYTFKALYPPIIPAFNFRLGTEIHLRENILAGRNTTGVTVYSLCCAPAYVPPPLIPPEAIPLITNLTIGFIKKIDETGYVRTMQFPRPIEINCALVEIFDNAIPLGSINGYDLLPIICTD